MNGLKLYLEDDYDNLLKFIKVYDANVAYKTHRNVDTLLKGFRAIKKPRKE